MIDPNHLDLTDFLVTWYGPADRSAQPLPDSCAWLPEPLQEWHRTARRWDSALTFNTTMIQPERIRIGDDGKAIFMVDATGDWRWCFDPEDPDGVFDAELYEPWEPNPERLAAFLLHNTIKEGVYGAAARMKALAVPEEALAEILAPMTELAFGAWKWPAPGHRIYSGDDVLVEFIKAEGGSGWDVQVAAPEPGRLSRLEDIAGVHWRKPKE